MLGIDYCIVSFTHGSGRGLSRAVCMRVARERVDGSESSVVRAVAWTRVGVNMECVSVCC